MANNRLYLVHKPTKIAVYLGKTMNDGWYDVPENLNERIQALYDHINSIKWEIDGCDNAEHAEHFMVTGECECDKDLKKQLTVWMPDSRRKRDAE